ETAGELLAAAIVAGGRRIHHRRHVANGGTDDPDGGSGRASIGCGRNEHYFGSKESRSACTTRFEGPGPGANCLFERPAFQVGFCHAMGGDLRGSARVWN